MSDPQATSGAASIDAAARSAAAAPSFWDQLQPASFRNVPFAVRGGGGQAGRRNAVHEYPFRDLPWVEDLGRQSRRIQIVGFVTGDDVIAQRARMIAAVEAPGDGELVHPTLGRVQVAVIGFDWEETEQGRTFAYRFQFVRQGQRLYPSSVSDGANAVASASSAAASASNAAFVAKAAGPLVAGASQANQVQAQAVAWSAQAQRVGNDATSLIKLAVSLPGNYGRLLGLASGVSVGEIIPATAGLTPQGLAAARSAARALVASACTALVSAASQIGIGNTAPFTDAVQALATAILNVASTPGDALRGLQSLANFVPDGVATGGGLVVQGACADLFRRASVVTLAIAGSKYQPWSSDDAADVRTQVLADLDTEITIAGDQLEDGVYASLRALRVQAVKDLNARGASLPGLVTVDVASSLPSLVLAQRLYRDPSRADELVSRAAPIHPAFMPRVLKALIS
jgi:prophage DNA circulation protein